MAKKKTETRLAAVPQANIHVNDTFKDYFLQYASYVITDRAIPEIADGLKPVQRRILHSFWENEDGRYNKVANIIGHTMKYHPHGDASIYSALVGLGQKELLIDTQGNWGDPVTGDSAAAARYIEGRLTKFAREVVFHPDLTTYMKSYDGRNKEPVVLPIRFPLLLALGAEGIAVGLSTKIMPHNFLELLNAQKACLRGEPFTLYPDFLTGGLIDVSNYQDGLPGSRIKVRAKLEYGEGKTVVITEIAFGTTTDSLIESILSASDKGKIKVARVEDNTSSKVEIVVSFQRGVEMESAIDALYAFTDCEVSISPNNVVIRENHPVIMSVSEMLAYSADLTKSLLRDDLEIQKDRLELKWHHKSLVQIFIENRIYLRLEKCRTWESVLAEIDAGLEPHKSKLRMPVTEDDLVMLTEVKMRRISIWDAERAKEELTAIDKELREIRKYLKNLTQYAIDFTDRLIEVYGKGRERKTVIATFDSVKAVSVVARTEKLYLDRAAGFLGTALKGAEELGPCSSMEDAIVFLENGEMKVVKIEERKYIGEKIIHAQIFGEPARELVFNMIYEDQASGKAWVKRFTVGGVTREKSYDMTGAAKKGRVLFLAQGDESYAFVRLRKKPRIQTELYVNFSDYLVKNRGAGGVVLSKHRVSSAKAISATVFRNHSEVEAEEIILPFEGASDAASAKPDTTPDGLGTDTKPGKKDDPDEGGGGNSNGQPTLF